MHVSDETRCVTMGRTAEAVVWVTQRRCRFTCEMLAEHLKVSRTTARRYLNALEVSGIVTCNAVSRPWTWRNSGVLRWTA